MDYTQNIFNLGTLDTHSYDNFLTKFVDSFNEKKFPLFNVQKLITEEDLKVAESIKQRYSHVIIVGMGGSILNPIMTTSLLREENNNPGMNIIFIDTLDINRIQQLISSLNLKETGVILISKSGLTYEVIGLARFLIDLFLEKGMPIMQHFFAITTEDSPLGNIVKSNNIIVLPHQNIGGRFATFTNVGVIPLILAGFNYNRFLKAAEDTVQRFIQEPRANYASLGAAFLSTNSKAIHVLMNYLYNTTGFANWHAQLLAESMGKTGKGITPIVAHCPGDYHTQMQLYLDGPQDKSFSLVVNRKLFENKLGKIIHGQFLAFSRVLLDKGLPFRTIEFDNYNENVLAQLAVNSMLEIIISCLYLNLNPFNQQGVELLKHHLSNFMSNAD